MLDVTNPSSAFKVDTSGCDVPSGQSVRNPSDPEGTTVAFTTYAWALLGTLQLLPVAKGTVSSPWNSPLDSRVSMTRQGCNVYSESPDGARFAGAKYPVISRTRSVSLLA